MSGSMIMRRGIHYLKKLKAANIPSDLIQQSQNRVIDASLTLIRERTKLMGKLVRALASTTLLGVPLGHNSSFLQGPAFAPPRIREAIWCGSTNSTTEEGKELNDPRVLTNVGDIPVQEIRDCGEDDDRLMSWIYTQFELLELCPRNNLVMNLNFFNVHAFQDPLRPLVLGGDHSISFLVVKAVSEKLGGHVDILHLDAHPDIYDAFEGNKYSHASSFARIMEGGYARRLLQGGCREGLGESVSPWGGSVPSEHTGILGTKLFRGESVPPMGESVPSEHSGNLGAKPFRGESVPPMGGIGSL
ncbi:Arginase 1 [Hibiscus syriacus]|uniref:Arginase 1 n=1 Tax=Hibiscus syriacus TaxID=106335 RepID=A0A6A2Y305_HIBSY|nr:Arginase 1 [Hibiscus syriacus]